MFLKLFLIFLIVPYLEITLLIKIGSRIGLWPTLALILFTALFGAALARSQGIRVLKQLQGQLIQGVMPTQSLLEGAVVLLAGFFLIMPGFLTDTLGFLLLIPPLRKMAIAFLAPRFGAGILKNSSAKKTATQNPNEVSGGYRILSEERISP